MWLRENFEAVLWGSCHRSLGEWWALPRVGMTLGQLKSAARLHHFLTMVPLGTLLNLSMAQFPPLWNKRKICLLEMFVYFEVLCVNGSYYYVPVSVPCVIKHSIR